MLRRWLQLDWLLVLAAIVAVEAALVSTGEALAMAGMNVVTVPVVELAVSESALVAVLTVVLEIILLQLLLLLMELLL